MHGHLPADLQQTPTSHERLISALKFISFCCQSLFREHRLFMNNISSQFNTRLIVYEFDYGLASLHLVTQYIHNYLE